MERAIDTLIPRAEAAELLGVKPSTLAAWACLKSVDLPYVRIGSRAMYRRKDIEQFIQTNLID